MYAPTSNPEVINASGNEGNTRKSISGRLGVSPSSLITYTCVDFTKFAFESTRNWSRLDEAAATSTTASQLQDAGPVHSNTGNKIRFDRCVIKNYKIKILASDASVNINPMNSSSKFKDEFRPLKEHSEEGVYWRDKIGQYLSAILFDQGKPGAHRVAYHNG